MKKPKLLYLFPTNFEHEGLAIKVKGQVQGFSAYFDVKLYPFLYKRSGNPLFKGYASLWYQKLAWYRALFYNKIYVRYNPKMIFLNIGLGLMSYFKPIYFEHNVNLNTELVYLKRPLELKLHRFTTSFFKWSRLYHTAVTPELNQYVHNFGVPKSRIITIQNGYFASPIDPNKVQTEHLENLKKLKESGKKIVIFSGAGSGWHGVSEWIKLFQTIPDISLVIAGPYTLESNSLTHNVIALGTIQSDTLKSLYPYCDLGLGTFSWDALTMTQASPLKTREYLCYGLPILVNYWDCAEEFEGLKPAIFNLRQGPPVLDQALQFSGDRDALQKLARDCFDWRNLLRALSASET